MSSGGHKKRECIECKGCRLGTRRCHKQECHDESQYDVGEYRTDADGSVDLQMSERLYETKRSAQEGEGECAELEVSQEAICGNELAELIEETLTRHTPIASPETLARVRGLS